MGNGEDLLDEIARSDLKEIKRLRDWDKGLDSDHNHILAIDSIEKIYERERAFLKASVEKAPDQTQELPYLAAEDMPLKTRIKHKTSMTLFGGLIKFDGLDPRDIGRLGIGGVIIFIAYYLFKLVEALQKFTPEV